MRTQGRQGVRLTWFAVTNQVYSFFLRTLDEMIYPIEVDKRGLKARNDLLVRKTRISEIRILPQRNSHNN